jgi:hypothetical protein
MKKEFAGMGIPNLQDLNLCLIGSWIKRYIQGGRGPLEESNRCQVQY